MLVIEGTLVNDSAEDTRIYTIKERDIQEYIIERNDEDFIKNESNLLNSGVYILIGYPSYGANPKVYVGQTMNISRRMSEHIVKKDFWQYIVVFQKLTGMYNNSEVMYLEHILIKNLIEYGNVQLLENCQIPKKPYLSDVDEIRMNEVFDNIKLLLRYSGYDFFRYKQYNYVVEDKTTNKKSHNIVSRIAKEYQNLSTPHYSVACESEIEYYNEYEQSMTYQLFSSDYHAEVIPIGEKFMIMPFGRVKPRSNDDIDKMPDEAIVAVDWISCNIIKDMTVDDLETVCLIVTNSTDTSLIKENVTYF